MLVMILLLWLLTLECVGVNSAGWILFDMRVTDTDATSYVGCSVNAVLTSAEQKIKYLSAAEISHASFTPFVVSVDGA